MKVSRPPWTGNPVIHPASKVVDREYCLHVLVFSSHEWHFERSPKRVTKFETSRAVTFTTMLHQQSATLLPTRQIVKHGKAGQLGKESVFYHGIDLF